MASDLRSADTPENRQTLNNYFSGVALIMAVLLAVVGGLGLMGAMSVNVSKRTREVGVIRAIGTWNGAVGQIGVIEGVVIGVLSWLLRGSDCVAAGQRVSHRVGMRFLGAPVSYTFAGAGAWLRLGIVVGLAALASFLPAGNAARLTVRDTWAYQ